VVLFMCSVHSQLWVWESNGLCSISICGSLHVQCAQSIVGVGK